MDAIRLNWQLLALLLVAGQALLFACLLLLQRLGNRKANTALAVLVLLLLWHHLDFVINTSFWYQLFPYLYTPHYFSWYFFGPLLFLYIKYLLQPEYKPRWLLWAAFLPGCLAALNYAPLYSMATPRKVEYIRQAVILNLPADTNAFATVLPSTLIFTGQVVMLAVFLWLCFQTLRNARLRNRQQELAHSEPMLRWLYLVLASFALATMCSGFFLRAIWLFQVVPMNFSIYFSIAPLTVFLIVLELGTLLNPDVYARMFDFANRRQKYTSSSLGDGETARIVAVLHHHMQSAKPYLDSQLRINTLSRDLGIPVNHLSQAINQQLGKNFTEFINSYRVDAAKDLLQSQDGTAANLLTIALQVGFNNKTSFLNAFRKAVNMSPSHYRKSLEQAK